MGGAYRLVQVCYDRERVFTRKCEAEALHEVMVRVSCEEGLTIAMDEESAEVIPEPHHPRRPRLEVVFAEGELFMNIESSSLRAAAVSAAVLGLGLSACQEGEGGSFVGEEELVVGVPDESSFVLRIANGAGKSVAGFAIKLPGEQTFSSNMMASDDRLPNGESCTLYVPKVAVAGDDYVVEIKVTFNDGAVSVLHHLDLTEFDACTLLLSGKVSYVVYQGKTAGRSVSTLELQQYYYNLEDPNAAARDAAEEEEEKRRLEKLEEDLENAEADSSKSTDEDVQGSDVEDDAVEYESDDREYGEDE